MNRKGLKTTIVASVMGALGLIVFVLWFVGEIDNAQFTMGLAGIGTFGSTILGLLAKDATASHSLPSRRSDKLIGNRPRDSR